MAGALAPERMQAAIDTIAHWRTHPDDTAACPQCGTDRLDILDCSARPHAEWYRLTCAACGLEAMLNVPLGARVPGGEG